jgi:hypothetical protein
MTVLLCNMLMELPVLRTSPQRHSSMSYLLALLQETGTISKSMHLETKQRSRLVRELVGWTT